MKQHLVQSDLCGFKLHRWIIGLAVSLLVLAQPQPVLDHSFFARTLLFNLLQLSVALLIVAGVGLVQLPYGTAAGAPQLPP